MHSDMSDRGGAERLSPLVSVVTAPNPGPMTYTGTRTYVAGAETVAVIDPGPEDAGHFAAVEAVIGRREVAAVLVTHAHLDHSAGARALATRLRAPVLAHGDPVAARSPVMARLAAEAPGLGGGEGLDPDFVPDRRLREGARVSLGGQDIVALHTPGHIGDHLCFRLGNALFTGDLVMGWASTMISPPDGDLTAFRASIKRLMGLDAQVFHPGHGPDVTEPGRTLRDLLAHRDAREAQILSALSGRPARIPDLVAAIYRDVDPRLHPAAARNVLAHLIDLTQRGRVAVDGGHGTRARYRRLPEAETAPSGKG